MSDCNKKSLFQMLFDYYFVGIIEAHGVGESE